MSLSDVVLGFKLLNSAGLSETDRQLVLTAAKQETVYYTKSGSQHHSSNRRSGFNRSSSGEKGQKMKNTQKGTTPLDR